MKQLPPGKYALSIAHPGHELRLYGFLEKTKPYIFILTDGGLPGDTSRMARSILNLGSLYKDTAMMAKDKRDVVYTIERPNPEKGQDIYMKDYEIINDVENKSTAFFEYYIKKMANTLLFNKIDHMVVDALEEYNMIHDVNRLLTEAAISLIKRKSGKEISLYEFNVSNYFNSNINEDCIEVKLDKETGMKKMKYILFYHPSVFIELKQNFTLDVEYINKLSEIENGSEEIGNTLLLINPGFFKYEYLRPAAGIPSDENYTRHIMPLREKLMKI